MRRNTAVFFTLKIMAFLASYYTPPGRALPSILQQPPYGAIHSIAYMTEMIEVSPGSPRTWNQLLLISSTEETTPDTSATMAGQLSAVCLNGRTATIKTGWMSPAPVLGSESIGDRRQETHLLVCSFYLRTRSFSR